MRVFNIITLCLASLIGLSACGTNIMHNNALSPAGYKHHNSEFKSSNGQSAENIGYTYSPNINKKSLTIWDNIAADLIVQMEKHYNITPQAIYLQPHAENNLFINSYDYALRKALLKKGYDITHTPQNIANLYYEAKPAKNKNEQSNLQNVEFILTITYDNKLTDQLHTVETLPKFYNRFETTYSKTYLANVKHLEKNLYWKRTNIDNMPKNKYTPSAKNINAHTTKPITVQTPSTFTTSTFTTSITPHTPRHTKPPTQLIATEQLKKEQIKPDPYLYKDPRRQSILSTNPVRSPQTGPYPPSGYKRSTE